MNVKNRSTKTMNYLDLDILKKQLNIDACFTDDDAYISQLGEVAEQRVAHHLDDNLESIVADNNGVLPAPIKQAMLLYVGLLYANREGIAFANPYEIPLAYKYLLASYKNYNHSAI